MNGETQEERKTHSKKRRRRHSVTRSKCNHYADFDTNKTKRGSTKCENRENNKQFYILVKRRIIACRREKLEATLLIQPVVFTLSVSLMLSTFSSTTKEPCTTTWSTYFMGTQRSEIDSLSISYCVVSLPWMFPIMKQITTLDVSIEFRCFLIRSWVIYIRVYTKALLG